ncbi:hypothetical protein EON65_32820 [archaeon]|nr:MAG: hypothetical protein EON65_32820 [archaeon]
MNALFLVGVLLFALVIGVAGDDGFDEFSRMLATDGSILSDEKYVLLSDFELFHDPPNGHFSPTALGVFVWSNLDGVKIYYEDSNTSPTIGSSYATKASPYIELDTPFKGSRNRTLTLIGIYTDSDGRLFKSQQLTLKYFVEASARPFSYGYLIPGIESSGYFVQFAMEIKGSARAQAAGSQEFADFFTSLGIGTYSNQIQALNLLAIDRDLQGFEGGFPCKISFL